MIRRLLASTLMSIVIIVSLFITLPNSSWKYIAKLGDNVVERVNHFRGAKNHLDEASKNVKRSPINAKYSGKVYPVEKLPEELRNKYPNSVRFSKDGYPDFSPYAEKELKIKGLNGNHAHDFKLANQAAGYKRTPDNFTWHHHEDMETMLLIPTDLHQAIRHSGGASLLKEWVAK